jgi:serine/threonine protein kinase
MLKKYVSGALDEPAAAKFGQHLEHCSTCQRRVDQRAHDSLIRALQHPPAHVSPTDETILNRMIDRAQRVAPVSQVADETVATAPPEAVSLDVFVTCLNKSGLFNPSEVELLLERNTPADSASFAKLLIGRKKLTRFQAKMLVRGRWKGLVLGNYILLEKLGQGGMGAVFKARHRRMSRDVCLKVLHASHRKSPGILERFKREAQTVAALQHPNIVVAHDADEAEGVPFLVMEYIQGSDLAQRVAKTGPLSAKDAIAVMLQTARALDHAHRRGVIHRDIKPHNLLVDETGTVKILDMGLARFDTYLSQNADATTHASMTVSGVIMGTVDYMAPEQALNSRRADHRSDIYSLGCTLHFLLTGQVVYAGDTLMEKLVAHREQKAPGLRARCTDASTALDAVFQHMVAKDPDERYTSMAEVVEDLEALQSGRKPRALKLLAPSSRRWVRHAVAGLAVITLVGTLGLSLWLSRSAWLPSGEPNQVQNDNKALVPAPQAARPSTPTLVGHAKTRANGGPGRALLIVPHDYFIEGDYASVEKALKSRGIDFATASSKPGPANPKHNAIPPVPVELTLDSFDVNDFDAVVFLGGSIYEFTKLHKTNGERTRRIIAECLDKGRSVAAVNTGIMVLDDAGVTGKANFEQKGGCWIGRSPGRAGVLITTKDNKYADEFVQTISEIKSDDEKSGDK